MSKLILAIDDDLDILQAYKSFISYAGYKVFAADAGKEAIKLANDLKPDLIILDIMMPGMSGHEVCMKLQEYNDLKNIPVVFVTALSTEKDKAKAFICGAVDYLVKPFNKDELLEKIEINVRIKENWNKLSQPGKEEDLASSISFREFKDFLKNNIGIDENSKAMRNFTYDKVYSVDIGINYEDKARLIAKFLNLEFVEHVSPYMISLGSLPISFSKKYKVLPVFSWEGDVEYLMSNPFNVEAIDAIRTIAGKDAVIKIISPNQIDELLDERKVLSDEVENWEGKKVALFMKSPELISRTRAVLDKYGNNGLLMDEITASDDYDFAIIDTEIIKLNIQQISDIVSGKISKPVIFLNDRKEENDTDKRNNVIKVMKSEIEKKLGSAFDKIEELAVNTYE